MFEQQMGLIKVSMVLWITFFILAKSSDNEEDGWSDDEVEITPFCVPNFFKPVSEPCVCVGSGKTIEVAEVGKLYCFPQPNKFQVQIEENKYQMISTPRQYEDNMVPNEELKSNIFFIYFKYSVELKADMIEVPMGGAFWDKNLQLNKKNCINLSF